MTSSSKSKAEPFWKPCLDILQQLAREPVAPIDELRMLQRQLEAAISMVESGKLVPMSEAERIEHASRFGAGAFVIGDFVITKRNPVLAASTGSATFTRFHMSLSVRGALNWPKAEMRRLAKSMTKPDGSAMTPQEAREALMDELAKGHEVVPIGTICDNWDWKEGCKGHRVQSPNAGDKV